MKNLLKFVVFVGVLSLAISALYDYQLRHGGLNLLQRQPEKYTLATDTPIDSKSIASLEELNRERRALVNSVIPSVVAVKTSKKIVRREDSLDPFQFFFRNSRQFRTPHDEALIQNSLGSGVIVTNEGHIITNNHVVDQVDEIEVQLSDGQTRKARLIGADAQVDLAVLKIDDPPNVKPLKLADSDTVQAGDFVLAIGNPFGFEETVTDGIISSKGRPNRADAFGDLLQTNAAINPGNSGGPLINLRGEVIGINTAIISRSGGSQGIGFAIPSNTVRTALESLLKQGRIIRGYLGIQGRIDRGQQATPEDGVVVDYVVPGSPAADAHLQKGDIIRKFNGHEVKNFLQLRTLVSQVELNKNVDVEIDRDGQPMKVAATIKEQPVDYLTQNGAQSPSPAQQPPAPDEDENQGAPPGNRPPAPSSPATGLSGISVADLTPQIAQQLDLPNGIRGVIVSDVDPSVASTDLQKGDVIEEVNQQPVATVADFRKAAAKLDPAQPQVLSICRHRTRSFVVVRPH